MDRARAAGPRTGRLKGSWWIVMKIRILLLIVLMLGSAAFISVKSRPEVTPIRASLTGLPLNLGEWTGQDAPPMDSRVMNVLGVDDHIDRTYYNAERYPASLYVGYYQSQRSGDTMHSPLNCLPGAGWNPSGRGQISIPVEGRDPIEVNRIVISKGLDQQLVLYWYQSHGRVVASEYWGKIYTVLDALRTNRTDAALVRVICPVGGAAEAKAEREAVRFVQSFFPLLDDYLPH